MEDYLVKALVIKVQYEHMPSVPLKLLAKRKRRHDTWSSSAALGRTLIGALLLGATLKGDDKLTVKVQGNGQLALLLSIVMAAEKQKATLKSTCQLKVRMQQVKLMYVVLSVTKEFSQSLKI